MQAKYPEQGEQGGQDMQRLARQDVPLVKSRRNPFVFPPLLFVSMSCGKRILWHSLGL